MMRNIIILFAVVIAFTVRAEPRAYIGDATVSTNGNAVMNIDGLRGAVDSISLASVDGALTCSVAVVVKTLDGLSPDVVVATGQVVKAKTWMPRVAATDISGNALTNSALWPVVLSAERISASISEAPTSSTWRITIKTQ